MVGNSLFGAVKLTVNADPNKYKCSGCIALDLMQMEVFCCLLVEGLVKMLQYLVQTLAHLCILKIKKGYLDIW